MTTRYSEGNLIEGLSGTIHETGHSLYEQGRNKEYIDLPVSKALSMGIHESQSLLWERMVGLSSSFLSFYYPEMYHPKSHLNSCPNATTLADSTVTP